MLSAGQADQRQLGMFAKYWEAGQVKTRLATSIGPTIAAEVYRHFVVTLLRRFEAHADCRKLCVWPPERKREMEQLAGEWSVDVQSSGELGQRMRCYFDAAFRSGAGSVVLIGSDSPNLPIEIVEEAFSQLENDDFVLGPTPDGGYYLIGMRRTCPEIFANVAWSTPHVWEQTIDNIARANYSLGVLPPWYDIDDFDDLQRLRGDLAATTDPELAKLRSALEQLLSAVAPSHE